MLIPSGIDMDRVRWSSLSRRVNANSQPSIKDVSLASKLIKKGEC